ncbi:MAG: hypothetical protein OHK0044_16100 [Burkholderiaceae bacterium]
MDPSAADSLFEDDDAEPAGCGSAHRAGGAVEPAAFSEDLLRLGRQLPRAVYLGTSSWSFPGWRGLVYGGHYAEAQLARAGLAAYSRHPVLRAVGLDRGFYQPLRAADYARYAVQTPEHFRFLVKAPARLTDAVLRGERGAPTAANPDFLDAVRAGQTFVGPALEGLGAKAGVLLFQLSPLPREAVRDAAAHATIERIGAFFAALSQTTDGLAPTVALELRNTELLTPRLVRTLRAVDVRLCVAVHPRMPEAARQSAALRAMDAAPEEGDAWRLKGPLVVRWTLHAGLAYAEAKTRYAPFDRLIDADIVTRGALAHLVHVALRSAQPAYVIVNNKAEGSAPLSCIELAKAVVGR